MDTLVISCYYQEQIGMSGMSAIDIIAFIILYPIWLEHGLNCELITIITCIGYVL